VDLLDQKYFDDMKVGDKCISVGRTVTEADIVNFAGISGDYNILHTDAEYAKTSIAGQRLAHGLLPLVIASGLYTRTPYGMSMTGTLTAFVEIKSWKFKKPVLIGDTVHVEVEIIEKIDAKPESASGKIVMKRTILNQKNEVVQEGEFILLIKKRSV
jgi:acyl dehydratase